MLKSRCDCRDEGLTGSSAPQQVGKEAESLLIYSVLPEGQKLLLCPSGTLSHCGFCLPVATLLLGGVVVHAAPTPEGWPP